MIHFASMTICQTAAVATANTGSSRPSLFLSGMSEAQHDYVQRVKNFAAFLGRSPDTASFEDVRRYQLHLAASGVGVSILNQTVSTLQPAA